MVDELSFDTPALKANVDMIGRTGAKDFEVGYDDNHEPVTWYAKASYTGAEVRADGLPGPVEATDELAKKLLDGGLCVHCKRRVTLDSAGDLTQCYWARIGSTWLRGCEVEHPTDGPVSTARKLALALNCAGAPLNMIEAAINGYFDDWQSDLPFPIMTLVEDCQRLAAETGNERFTDIANRAKDGEFDGTKAESDAWAQSAEGQATFAELTADLKEAGRNQTRFDPPVPRNRAERRRAERNKRNGST